MTRDQDLDALAEEFNRRLQDRESLTAGLGRRLRGWLARLVRRVLAKMAGPAIAAVGLAMGLAMLGVDLGWLLMAMFYASPFMAVAVAGFIAHAWRQNTGLTYSPPAADLEPAEPGQPGQDRPVGQANQDEPANLPARPATVTVTVLPGPVAALPQAVGHTTPIRHEAEEETS